MALDKVNFSSIFGEKIGGVDYIKDLTENNNSELGVKGSNQIKTETLDFSDATNQVNVPNSPEAKAINQNVETNQTNQPTIPGEQTLNTNQQTTNVPQTQSAQPNNQTATFGPLQNQSGGQNPYEQSSISNNFNIGGENSTTNSQAPSTQTTSQNQKYDSPIGPQQVRITEEENKIENSQNQVNSSTGSTGGGTTWSSTDINNEQKRNNITSNMNQISNNEKEEQEKKEGQPETYGKNINENLSTRTQYAYDVEQNTRKEETLGSMQQFGLEEGEYDKYINILDETIRKEEASIKFTEENELRLLELYKKKDANGKFENAKELLDIIYSSDPTKKLNFNPLTGEKGEELTTELWEEEYAKAKELSPDNIAFKKETYSELTEEEKTIFVKEYAKVKLEEQYKRERKQVYEDYNEIDIESGSKVSSFYKKENFNDLTEEEKIEFIGLECEYRYSQLTFSVDDVKEWGANKEYLDKMTDSLIDRKTSVKQLKYMKHEAEMQKEIYSIEKVVYTDDYKNYKEKGITGYEDKKYLNSEQNKILDYIYNEQGKEKADEYMYALRGQIAKGKGIEEANEFLKELERDPEKKNKFMEVLSDADKFAKCLEEGFIDGVGTFGEGVKNLFSNDNELSALEWKEQVIMEVLSQNKKYSSKWCDKAYQYGNVVGNLAPSMLASAAVTAATGGAAAPAALSTIFESTGQMAGLLTMTISATGNSKHQALMNGGNITESWAYGICSGISEATMERFLGSIPGLSRLEGGYLKKLVAEGIEEGSQEFVSAALNSVILGENIDIGDVVKQAEESFEMGAAVSALLNIGSLRKRSIKLTYNGKNIEITESTRQKIQEEIDKINNGEIEVEEGNKKVADILQKSIEKQTGETNADISNLENIEVEQNSKAKNTDNTYADKLQQINESGEKITADRANENSSKEVYKIESELKKAAQDIKKTNKQKKKDKKNNELEKVEQTETNQERIRITEDTSIEESTESSKINKRSLQESAIEIKKIAGRTVKVFSGTMIAFSGAVLALAGHQMGVPIGLSIPVGLSVIYNGGKLGVGAVRNNKLKGTFLETQDIKTKVNGKVEKIIKINQNVFAANDFIKSRLIDNKQEYFMIRSINAFQQLKENTKYCTYSQANTYMLLREMQKQGFIKNLQKVKSSKNSNLGLERFLLGVKHRDKKITMYDITFETTNNKLNKNSIEKILDTYKVDMDKYNIKTNKNGNIIYDLNISKNINSITVSGEKIKSQLANINNKIRPKYENVTSRLLDSIETGKQKVLEFIGDERSMVISGDTLERLLFGNNGGFFDPNVFNQNQYTPYEKDSFVVVSDFHGADWVMNKVKSHYMNEYETIFNLGDITDRGKVPFELLGQYMDLSKQNPNRVIYVPGNHDSFLYGAYMAPDEQQRMNYRKSLNANGGTSTINAMDNLRATNPARFNEIILWLGNQPLQRIHTYNGKKYALAHAFFNKNIYNRNPNYALKDYVKDVHYPNGLKQAESNILWFRKGKDSYNPADLPSSDYTMVVGHTPNADNLSLGNVNVICVDGAASKQDTQNGSYSTRKFDGGSGPEFTVLNDHNDTSHKNKTTKQTNPNQINSINLQEVLNARNYKEAYNLIINGVIPTTEQLNTITIGLANQGEYRKALQLCTTDKNILEYLKNIFIHKMGIIYTEDSGYILQNFNSKNYMNIIKSINEEIKNTTDSSHKYSIESIKSTINEISNNCLQNELNKGKYENAHNLIINGVIPTTEQLSATTIGLIYQGKYSEALQLGKSDVIALDNIKNTFINQMGIMYIKGRGYVSQAFNGTIYKNIIEVLNTEINKETDSTKRQNLENVKKSIDNINNVCMQTEINIGNYSNAYTLIVQGMPATSAQWNSVIYGLAHQGYYSNALYLAINSQTLPNLKNILIEKIGVTLTENGDYILDNFNEYEYTKIINAINEVEQYGNNINHLEGIKQELALIYTDYIQHKNNGIILKNEINNTIDRNWTQLEKARKLYIELNKRLRYDVSFYKMDETQQSEFIKRKINFSNLNSDSIICSSWSQLYYELLVENGFDNSDVKIMGGEKHKWIEINIGNGIIIADATEAIDGATDLVNCKIGYKTHGFFFSDNNRLSGRRLNKLYENNTINLDSVKNSYGTIDSKIGYSSSNGYKYELIQKANSMFSSDNLSIDDGVYRLVKTDIPKNMDGLEVYSYFKKITNLLSPGEKSRINLGLFSMPNGNSYEGVFIMKYEMKGHHYYYTFSKKTGINIYDNVNSYNSFIVKNKVGSIK